MIQVSDTYAFLPREVITFYLLNCDTCKPRIQKYGPIQSKNRQANKTETNRFLSFSLDSPSTGSLSSEGKSPDNTEGKSPPPDIIDIENYTGASHTSVIKTSFSPITSSPTHVNITSVLLEDEYIDPVGDDDQAISLPHPPRHLGSTSPPPSISVIKQSSSLLQNQFSSREELNKLNRRYTETTRCVYNNGQRFQPYNKHRLHTSMYSDVVQSRDFVPSSTYAHNNNIFSTSLLKPRYSVVDYEIYRKHLSEIYLSRSYHQSYSRFNSTMEQQDPYLVSRHRDVLLHEHPYPPFLRAQRYTRALQQDEISPSRRSEETSFDEQKHMRQFYEQRKRKSMSDLMHPVHRTKGRYERAYERHVAMAIDPTQHH